MKKLLIVLALGVGLGGCSTLQNLQSALSLTTASIANPVTNDKLLAIESATQIAITGLQAYKAACVKGTADKNCKANVKAIQQYTVKLPPILTQLRGFVKSNDMINATVVYNQLTQLIANVQTTATNAGLTVGN